jgi:hypothetical protein
LRQTGTRQFNRLLGEEFLVSRLKPAEAFPCYDSAGGTVDSDGVSYGGYRSLAGFIPEQTVVHELEPDVFLGLHHHVRVVHMIAEEICSAYD